MSAVVTLKNPAGNLCYGFTSRTQLFGSAAGVLHYDRSSRAIAFAARRILEAPRSGYFGNFGKAAPSSSVSFARKAFAGLNDALFVDLRRRTS